MVTMKNVPQTAENELTHSMVHYLLTIHKLKEKRGYARVTDIAKDLEITKGSVSTALGNLKKRGLVIEEDDSKFLNLSDEGHNEVHKILTSRTLIYYFLKDFVQVDEDTAHKDSCLMEHLMSDETREKFFLFMKKLSCECTDERGTRIGQFDFSTALDLCQFDTSEELEAMQVGDSALPPENSVENE